MRETAKRKVRQRLVLAIVPFVLLAAGLVGWVRQEPLVLVSRTGVSIGFLPFWAAACFVVGLVFLVLLIAVGDLRHLLRWSTALLFLLWVLQFATVTGVYPQPFPSPDPNYHPPLSLWFTRWTTLSSRWWGLVLLALAVLVIAIGSRSRSRRRPSTARV
jgi:hypothetical protein